MKRTFVLGFLGSMLLLSACKHNEKNKEQDTAATTTSSSGSGDQKPAIANQPKEYKVTFSPDSALLGKSKEALVKITGATAIVLQDPDGKDNGIELSVKLTLTNRNHIESHQNIHVDYTNSRLQLDNGTSITDDSGTDFLRAEPEATSKEETWTYKIPAGVKPTALNLFMDETRVSVNVSLQ